MDTRKRVKNQRSETWTQRQRTENRLRSETKTRCHREDQRPKTSEQRKERRDKTKEKGDKGQEKRDKRAEIKTTDHKRRPETKNIDKDK